MKSPPPRNAQSNVPDDWDPSARRMPPRVTKPRVFFVKAEDGNGQNLDLFVAAHSRMSAQRHYEDWCRENSWVPHVACVRSALWHDGLTVALASTLDHGVAASADLPRSPSGTGDRNFRKESPEKWVRTAKQSSGPNKQYLTRWRLIMDDCTPHEIMSVTGHRTLKEIDRYARDYIREKAATSVLAK